MLKGVWYCKGLLAWRSVEVGQLTNPMQSVVQHSFARWSMCALSVILHGTVSTVMSFGFWVVLRNALRCSVAALVLRMIALPLSMARAQTGNSTQSLRQVARSCWFPLKCMLSRSCCPFFCEWCGRLAWDYESCVDSVATNTINVKNVKLSKGTQATGILCWWLWGLRSQQPEDAEECGHDWQWHLRWRWHGWSVIKSFS